MIRGDTFESRMEYESSVGRLIFPLCFHSLGPARPRVSKKSTSVVWQSCVSFSLHTMLDHLDDNNSNKSSRTSAVTGISWLEDGMGFKIVNPKRFSQQALPEYFDTLKYKSFIRQVS
jgi:HSF-type DNA-binding